LHRLRQTEQAFYRASYGRRQQKSTTRATEHSIPRRISDGSNSICIRCLTHLRRMSPQSAADIDDLRRMWLM